MHFHVERIANAEKKYEKDVSFTLNDNASFTAWT